MYTLKSALMQLVQLEQAAASSLAKQLRSTGLIIYHAQFMNTIVPSFFSWFATTWKPFNASWLIFEDYGN